MAFRQTAHSGSSAVVVGGRQGRGLRRSAFVLIGCAVVLIAAGITVWLLSGSSPDSPAAKQQADKQQFTKLQSQTTAQAASGRFKQAAAAWKAYAAATPSPSHEKAALEQAGAMEMSSGNFSQAAADYKAASAIQTLSYAEAAALAQAYIRLGQKTDAVHYLQQALRLMPTDLDGFNAQQAADKQEIQSLGGS